MLSSGQFGDRQGHNTIYAMYIVASKIKDAWHVGKVTLALFLDVQGAFPNTVKDQLIHNMKAHGVSTNYTDLVASMLTNRRTHLKFNYYTSSAINIIIGTIQGCPLSMILYAFYNAPLIETAIHKHEKAMDFVDNCMDLAVADFLLEAHAMINEMRERQGGSFYWSTSHNSPFELSKLVLMNLSCSSHNMTSSDLTLSHINPDGSSTDQSINTVVEGVVTLLRNNPSV